MALYARKAGRRKATARELALAWTKMDKPNRKGRKTRMLIPTIPAEPAPHTLFLYLIAYTIAVILCLNWKR